MILGFPCNVLVKWMLTTPVQFFLGWRFHKGAIKSIKRGTANMDVLVSLGTNAAYFYSVGGIRPIPISCPPLCAFCCRHRFPYQNPH